MSDSLDNLAITICSATQSILLKFVDVYAFWLSKEMRRKSVKGVTKDVLFMRGRSQDMKNRSSRGRSKSRGRCKSLGKYENKCLECGKVGNYTKKL